MNYLRSLMPTQVEPVSMPQKNETPKKENPPTSQSGWGEKISNWFQVEAGKSFLVETVVKPTFKVTRMILDDMQTGDPIPEGRRKVYSYYSEQERKKAECVDLALQRRVDPHRIIDVFEGRRSSGELTSKDLQIIKEVQRGVEE